MSHNWEHGLKLSIFVTSLITERRKPTAALTTELGRFSEGVKVGVARVSLRPGTFHITHVLLSTINDWINDTLSIRMEMSKSFLLEGLKEINVFKAIRRLTHPASSSTQYISHPDWWSGCLLSLDKLLHHVTVIKKPQDGAGCADTGSHHLTAPPRRLATEWAEPPPE